MQEEVINYSENYKILIELESKYHDIKLHNLFGRLDHRRAAKYEVINLGIGLK